MHSVDAIAEHLRNSVLRLINMDDLLPSYESALEQDPWILVAPYLTSDALCAAAAVCKKWHEIFTPHLWGSPASHFGVENDTVYGTQSLSIYLYAN